MTNYIEFAGIKAAPGEKVTDYFTMKGSDHKIPVALINGKSDGKIMLITASIHGFEYPGIQAAKELIRELDPEKISGAVVIVPVVNVSGFIGRKPYICPDDELQQNLNRLAPGKADGTFGERLIYLLTHEFVKKSDFHLDLHSGDATEYLLPFCAVGNADDFEKKELVHEIVHHLTFEYHTMSTGRGEFYNGSAYHAGVPSMMFECGGNGMWLREDVDFEKDNICRIMQLLGILPGHPSYNDAVKCINRQAWIGCGATGFFYSFVKVGDEVKQGQKLFEIQDVWGNVLQEYCAEFDGKVFIVNSTLGCSEGDDAVFYGR